MPTRDKKRVYAELFGFKMAVRELNQSIEAQAKREKIGEFGPDQQALQAPEAENAPADSGVDPATRFVRAASRLAERSRR